MAALGTTQTWARVLFFSLNGTDADRGILTLLAALGVAGLSGWRIFSPMRERTYIIFAVLLSVVGFVMPWWFLIDIFDEPGIVTGGGLYLTVIAASGMLAAIGWHTYKWLPHRGDEHYRVGRP